MVGLPSLLVEHDGRVAPMGTRRICEIPGHAIIDWLWSKIRAPIYRIPATKLMRDGAGFCSGTLAPLLGSDACEVSSAICRPIRVASCAMRHTRLPSDRW
jgi:hypothetical protein